MQEKKAVTLQARLAEVQAQSETRLEAAQSAMESRVAAATEAAEQRCTYGHALHYVLVLQRVRMRKSLIWP